MGVLDMYAGIYEFIAASTRTLTPRRYEPVAQLVWPAAHRPSCMLSAMSMAMHSRDARSGMHAESHGMQLKSLDRSGSGTWATPSVAPDRCVKREEREYHSKAKPACFFGGKGVAMTVKYWIAVLCYTEKATEGTAMVLRLCVIMRTHVPTKRALEARSFKQMDIATEQFRSCSYTRVLLLREEGHLYRLRVCAESAGCPECRMSDQHKDMLLAHS